MNFVIANILSKNSMKQARLAIFKPAKELRDTPSKSIKTVFQNSYVDINYTLQQLGFDDKIGTYVSKHDVNLILEYAKEELKSYQKIGNFYVKWVWNWNTDHTIILLILVELIMAMVRPPK